MINRRKFLQMSTAGVAAGAVGLGLPSVAAAQTGAPAAPPGTVGAPIRRYSGTDLDSWEMVLGDGLWTATGQAPPAVSDLAAAHYGSHSTLSANVWQRGVMAHNINFRRIIDDEALNNVHACSFEFRLPYLPEIGAWPNNIQTIEGGLFVWDGGGIRKDIGVGFQWLLNPWMADQGDVRYWHRGKQGSWKSGGYLEPDMQWHKMEFVVDPTRNTGSVVLDGVELSSHWVAENKEGWGTETAARLQLELISLWPGDNSTAPRSETEFRNWYWDWYTPA